MADGLVFDLLVFCLYCKRLQLSSSVEVTQCLFDSSSHCLLALADPDTRVVVLLVWLIIT